VHPAVELRSGLSEHSVPDIYKHWEELYRTALAVGIWCTQTLATVRVS
jgi:hypothetical protein